MITWDDIPPLPGDAGWATTLMMPLEYYTIRKLDEAGLLEHVARAILDKERNDNDDHRS